MAKIKQFEAFTKNVVAYKKTGCSFIYYIYKVTGTSLERWNVAYYCMCSGIYKKSISVAFGKHIDLKGKI